MKNVLRLKENIISRFYGIIISQISKNIGSNFRYYSPFKMDGIGNMKIGDNVYVGYKTWLAAVSNNKESCMLSIGSGTRIGSFNHIFCQKSILIGKSVLTADKVYISDNMHEFYNPNTPIIEQSIKSLNPVVIGDGCWIGENVCIIGALVGRNSVIGANSVVINDIPDFSVAVGAPAKVIKRYNFDKNKWERV